MARNNVYLKVHTFAQERIHTRFTRKHTCTYCSILIIVHVYAYILSIPVLINHELFNLL